MEFKVAEIVKLCDFDILLIIYNYELREYYTFRSSDLWRPNIEDIVHLYYSCITPPPLTIISLYILNLRISFLRILRSLIRRRKGED
jgi:hypothetical protein